MSLHKPVKGFFGAAFQGLRRRVKGLAAASVLLSLRKRIKGFLGAALLAALTAAFCLACLYCKPKPVQRLDSLVYDSWMRLCDKPKPGPAPAIVEIDDNSLASLGQWPWPRDLLAELVQKILDAGAASVGLDILLAEPDRSSPAFLQADLARRRGFNVSIDGVPLAFMDNDLYFRDIINNKPVVLGAFADFHGGTLPDPMPKQLPAAENTPEGSPSARESLLEAKGLTAPLPLFKSAPAAVFNVPYQEDSVVRSVPLLIKAKDKLYPALSLRTLMAAQNSRSILIQSGNNGLEALKTGGVVIPVAENGIYRPLFLGPARTYPYFSAEDILAGRVGEEELKGRIIFIGASAAGLKDLRSTPLDPNMPGVEIHAALVDNFLSGRGILIPPYSTFIQICAVIAASAIFCAIFCLLPPALCAAGGALLLGGALWASWLFFNAGYFVTPVYVMLDALILGAVILPMRFWQERKARERLKSAFAHYVAPEVADSIAERGPAALEGRSREVSLLFTDVRDFTAISEKMDPDQLVRLLNNYFTPMTSCVIAHGGTLDKFIGDALMAFWNAPFEMEGHQEKALLAALDMRKKLADLRPYFLREFGADIRIGAGLHCGIARVGNMGTDDLMNYTCIGESVNLASRLESLTKRYGAGIIASSAIASRCGSITFRLLDRVQVKGSEKPIEIYTPIDEANMEEQDRDAEKLWRAALEAYFQGDFAGAAELFEKIPRSFSAPARAFHQRCAYLTHNKPRDWDGVWVYDSK